MMRKIGQWQGKRRGGWWPSIIGYSLLALGAISQAHAQVWPQGVTDVTSTRTLSTASGNCLNANPARKAISLDNKAGTINIGYCETAATTSTPCTAAIGTAGTTTLAAGEIFYSVPAPQNQYCFIAASGTPSFTIREGQ